MNRTPWSWSQLRPSNGPSAGAIAVFLGTALFFSAHHVRSTNTTRAHRRCTRQQPTRPALQRSTGYTLDRRVLATAPLSPLCDQTQWTPALAHLCNSEFATAAPARVSPSAPSLPVAPTLVWNGEGYGALWIDMQNAGADLYFARLSPTGERISAPVRLTRDAAFHAFPSLVWTGREYAIAWTRFTSDLDYDVYFLRVSAQGAAVGSPLRVSQSEATDIGGRIVWTGREFGITWLNVDVGGPSASLRFVRVNAAGQRVGREVTPRGNLLPSGLPSLAWGGNEYVIAFGDVSLRSASTMNFLSLNAEGSTGKSLVLSSERSLNGAVQAVWDGRTFAALWEELSPSWNFGSLAFASGRGSTVETRRTAITNRESNALQPSIAAANNEYAVTFIDDREGMTRSYFGRINRAGALQGSFVRLSSTSNFTLFPYVTWNGTEYATAWTDTRERWPSVYFARFNARGERVGSDVRIAP